MTSKAAEIVRKAAEEAHKQKYRVPDRAFFFDSLADALNVIARRIEQEDESAARRTD